MSQIEKLQPFKPFKTFLEREIEAMARLAGQQPIRRKLFGSTKLGDRGKGSDEPLFGTGADQNKRQYYPCAFRDRRDTIKHTTSDYKEFQKLPCMNACFVCFGNHPQQKCSNKKPCSFCGCEKHQVLLCKSEKFKTDPKIDFHTHAESASHATQGAGLPLYPIQQAKACEW